MGRFAKRSVAVLWMRVLYAAVAVQAAGLLATTVAAATAPTVARINNIGFPAAISGEYLFQYAGGSSVEVFQFLDHGRLVLGAITPENGWPEAFFGLAIAASDGWVLVGAPADGEGGEGAGAIYFFEQVGSKWIQRLKWIGAEGEALGTYIALNGDRAAAIVVNDDRKEVRMFRRDDNAWQFQQALTISDTAFASALALEQRTMLIGAPNFVTRLNGGVYVYEEKDGSWGCTQRLENPADHDYDFGLSVAIDNDRIAVGTQTSDGLQHPDVYLFSRTAEGRWTYNTKVLKPEDGGGRFGLAVALKEDVLLVGAPGWANLGGRGYAYFYRFLEDQWVLNAQFMNTDGNYGHYVSLSERYAIVGGGTGYGPTECYRTSGDPSSIPTANAGDPQEVAEGSTVRLDASGSFAATGGPLSYAWQQLSGPAVALSDPAAVSPRFVTPAVGPDGEALVFGLQVTDAGGLKSAWVYQTITVWDNGITGFDADVISFLSFSGQAMGIRVSGDASLVGLVAPDFFGELPPDADALPFGLVDIRLLPKDDAETATITFYFSEPLPRGCRCYAILPETGWYDTLAVFNSERTRAEINLVVSGNANLAPDQDGTLIFVAGAGCPSSTDGGYHLTGALWAKAVLQVSGSPVPLVWKKLGVDNLPGGDQVISGYFYADPGDFAYGSAFNPEVFVKAYVAANGWANIAFNHVTVDPVDLYSAHDYGGLADQSATATLGHRLVEHRYTGVGVP